MKKVDVYKVASPSMYPTLALGELVFLENIPFGHLHVGDIVGIECSKKLYIHRIVDIHTKDTYYITKGDNNDVPDYLLLDCQNYVGKAVYVMKHDKMISLDNDKRYEVTERSVADTKLYMCKVDKYKFIFDGIKCVVINIT